MSEEFLNIDGFHTAKLGGDGWGLGFSMGFL
jgi:hypothetical protein